MAREICIFGLLIVAAVWDIRFLRIPNRLIIIGAGFGLMYRVFLSGTLGIFTGMIHILIPILILFFFYQRSVLGAGDLKLLSIICCFMNWREWFNWLLMTMMCAGVIGVYYLRKGKKAMPMAIPMLMGWMVFLLKGGR